MRLAAIEKPPTFTARIAYWLSKRQLGRVMTPMKVFYARMPALFPLAYRLVQIERKGLVLDAPLRHLVKTWVAMTNGCSFCVDIAKAFVVLEHISLEKFQALPNWRTSPLYDERERAALAYVEEATKNREVQDATFAALRKHFSEREIVELTWLNAVENYYNLMNLPLGIEEDGLCAIAQKRVGAQGAAQAPAPALGDSPRLPLDG
jgi:alkylhydroperoxidase family enzyme